MSQKLQEVLSFTSDAHLAEICDFFKIAGIAILLDRQSSLVLRNGHSHILVAVLEHDDNIFLIRKALLCGHEAIKTALLSRWVFVYKELHDIFKHHLFTRLLFKRHHIGWLRLKLRSHIVREIIIISHLFLHLCNLVLQSLHVWIGLELFLGLFELLWEVLLPFMGFSEKRCLLIDTLNLILKLM